MTKDEALRMALEAMQMYAESERKVLRICDEAITAIKQALAAPVQEPVGWMSNKDFEPIRIRIMQEAYELADSNNPEGYNAIKVMCGDVQKMLSPQRTWVGLTDEEIQECLQGLPTQTIDVYARRIEAKLKQKNGYAEEKNT